MAISGPVRLLVDQCGYWWTSTAISGPVWPLVDQYSCPSNMTTEEQQEKRFVCFLVAGGDSKKHSVSQGRVC